MQVNKILKPPFFSCTPKRSLAIIKNLVDILLINFLAKKFGVTNLREATN